MKDKEELPNTKRSKKAYRQPQLQVYGDLRDDYSDPRHVCVSRTNRPK